MQTTLYASSAGTVDELLVSVGDSVESKDLIVRLR
jgi:biotin carboxyl carrier protein